MIGSTRSTLTRLRISVAGLFLTVLSGCNMYVIDFESSSKRLCSGTKVDLRPRITKPLAGSAKSTWTAPPRSCRVVE